MFSAAADALFEFMASELVLYQVVQSLGNGVSGFAEQVGA
jgi:hypothetical protein